VQDDHKVVALTLAPNEEQLLAAMDDGSLWGLDLTRLNNLPVSLRMVIRVPLQTSTTRRRLRDMYTLCEPNRSPCSALLYHCYDIGHWSQTQRQD
jgi:hypothetical protein